MKSYKGIAPAMPETPKQDPTSKRAQCMIPAWIHPLLLPIGIRKGTRITRLDDLIAKGDWTGIVAAKGKYQAIDEQLGQAPDEDLRHLPKPT